MSKVTIVLSDVRVNGRNVVSADFRLDADGIPNGAPPTPAMIAGVTIRQLWDSGELARLAPRLSKPRVVR